MVKFNLYEQDAITYSSILYPDSKIIKLLERNDLIGGWVLVNALSLFKLHLPSLNALPGL